VTHPAASQIALFSGGDLGRWESWRMARHIARCPQCRHEVAALRDAASQLRHRFQEMTDAMADLPNGLNWNRLAQEMTGNIRVGLAAGQAIALFDKPVRGKHRLGWPLSSNAALVALGAAVIFGVAFWTSLPPQQAQRLLASFERIRAERIGALIHSATSASAIRPEEIILEASSSSIQVRENGRAMSLIPHSDGATVSVNMHGSAGVRFVDADTGQVTTNKVYYAEQ
jgi:hypothetical protein